MLCLMCESCRIMQQVVTRDHAVDDDHNIKEQFDVLMFEQPPDLIQLSNAQIVLLLFLSLL